MAGTPCMSPGSCEVCGKWKAWRSLVYPWKPPTEEKDQYRKVWVHASCQRLLIGGARPAAVRRLGPTPEQLQAIVLDAEGALGINWYGDVDPGQLRPRERRAILDRLVGELERTTESYPKTYTEMGLRRTIAYAQRKRQPVATMNELLQLCRKLQLSVGFDDRPSVAPSGSPYDERYDIF